jgi:serine/threonine-protein kinase
MVCGVDPHVDTVLIRAFSKNPQDRFDTCEDFGQALADALALAPRSTMPTLPDERHASVEPANNRPMRVAAGGAAVGALVTIVAFQLTAQLRAPPEPDEPDLSESNAANTVPRSEAKAVAWLAERPAEPRASITRAMQSVEPVVKRRRRTNDAGTSDGGDDGSRDGGTNDAGQRDAGGRPRGKR